MDVETEKPEPNSEPIAESSIEADAAEIASNIEGRMAYAPPVEPAAGSDSGSGSGSEHWRKEPISNFKTDGAGRVRMRRNGKPIRKNGAPRKARKGDKLADGTIFEGEATKSGSRVFTGEEAPGESPPMNDGRPVLGPGFGDVAGETTFNIFEACFGLAWRPTDSERHEFKRQLSAAFAGMTCSALVAAIIVFLGYVFARLFKSIRQKREEKKATAEKRAEAAKPQKTETTDNAQGGSGADGIGEVAADSLSSVQCGF